MGCSSIATPWLAASNSFFASWNMVSSAVNESVFWYATLMVRFPPAGSAGVQAARTRTAAAASDAALDARRNTAPSAFQQEPLGARRERMFQDQRGGADGAHVLPHPCTHDFDGVDQACGAVGVQQRRDQFEVALRQAGPERATEDHPFNIQGVADHRDRPGKSQGGPSGSTMMWPISPALPDVPRTTSSFRTIPQPMPVPMYMNTKLPAPLGPPAHVSATAALVTSLSTSTE